MTFGKGIVVRSLRSGATGIVVGFGALQFSDDEDLRPVYLVQIRSGSSLLGPAVAVFRADLVEEVK